MGFLRTISTRRLAALVAGLVTAAAGGTAIALAAGSGGGPVPPPKPLAVAVHDALAAPAVSGVTARISFTNRLIDSASIEGSDPILTGATGRLWATKDRVRLELQSEQGDAQAVSDGKRFWVYDAPANTVYRGRIPQDSGTKKEKARDGDVPSLKRIQDGIARVMEHANLSGAVPSNVAGRPVYRVSISPKHAGGLLGSAALAWDAARGVPLRAAVYAQGKSSPVLELKATDISYGPMPASNFAVSPPPNAHVVSLSPPAGRERGGRKREVTGVKAVARALPFTLTAPGRLAGLPRRQVHLLDWDGSPAAAVTYGRGLGGIAVIEHRASPGKSGPLLGGRGGGESHNGLSLPQVSIDGASGRELPTALGTAIAFRRGGIDYTVLGAVSPATAEAAARGL